MNLVELIQGVRRNTRDFSNSIFREQDIIAFINEGINRVKQIIPELKSIDTLSEKTEELKILPPEYHHLISTYSSARCFSQDERHYQSTNLMNEFEVKMEELRNDIQSGVVVILDEDGNDVSIDDSHESDRVLDTYFGGRSMMDYDPYDEDDF